MTLEAFWAKVDKTETCWIWTGSKRKSGYGLLDVGRKLQLAHRFAFVTSGGLIPDGLHLDHLCRNRACVRPDHLEVVSNRTNVLRGVGISAENARRTHCVNGHELSGDNLWIAPRSNRASGVRRYCLACKRASNKKNKAAKRARERA
jgi:hypothetical protein